MATTLGYATANRQETEEAPIQINRIISSSSRPEPWNPFRERSDNFGKSADWFSSQRSLTQTHKRIAYNFADILQKHAPPPSKDAKSPERDADDNSATHPLDYLLAESYIASYTVGTGEDLTNLQCSTFLEAEHEIIYVTGFLSPNSASVKSINQTLRVLASRQTMRNIGRTPEHLLKVHICFSSSGFAQKIFHTRSPKGRIWKPKEWKKLGILDPKDVIGKIDLTVKSLFFRPVGLLHGKYMIVDRKTLIVPSANASWEEWLEGAMTYHAGSSPNYGIVPQFIRFWESVWQFGEEPGPANFPRRIDRFTGLDHGRGAIAILDKPRGRRLDTFGWSGFCPTVFLPHPYQRSFPPVWPLMDLPEVFWKIFRRLTGLAYTLPPADEEDYLGNPQNAFIMAAIEGAEESIYLHTPNVTAKPIINALLRAVKRGVVVEVVTSMQMMKVEQLVTAGTTTEKCLVKMIEDVQNFKKNPPATASTTGALFIYQYNAMKRPPMPPFVKRPEDNHRLKWFDKSHVKCLIVDEEVAMLGSGNADRASWVTSQEINVGLFLSKAKTGVIRKGLVDALAGRLEVVKGSTWVTGGAPAKDEESFGVDGTVRKRFDAV
ncbi:hypothetical protein ABW19_dt0203539 [Dactylella cylindrospora]|nr:hypothetical protein ABW19_dt0203539 [Dactylella cylindrospora]